jgi:hypothetical protein
MNDGKPVVWLWDAGERHSGVTDDPEQAKEAAAACLLRENVARVERAVVSFAWATGNYIRTGEGWQAIRPWRGPMTWEPL